MVGYAGGNVVAAGLPQTSFRHNIRSFVFALAVAFGTFQCVLSRLPLFLSAGWTSSSPRLVLSLRVQSLLVP